MEANLSSYRIFYEVAKSGNISKAAKNLYISQPAISKSIVKLEESLNTKLFQRNSRGVTLTEEGTILYQYVKEALSSIKTAETELRRIRDFNIGHIRIGASTTLCHHVLLPYLKKYIEKYPNIQVSILTQCSLRTVSLLEQGKLDIGLAAEINIRRKDIRYVESNNIHDIFVASPQYLENLKLMEKLSDGKDYLDSLFAKANLMMLEPHNISRQYIDNYLKNIGIEPVQILEVGTMDLLIELTKIGIGVSSVIREFVEDELKQGILTEIKMPNPIPLRSIGFIYNENNPSKPLKAFLDMLP